MEMHGSNDIRFKISAIRSHIRDASLLHTHLVVGVDAHECDFYSKLDNP